LITWAVRVPSPDVTLDLLKDPDALRRAPMGIRPPLTVKGYEAGLLVLGVWLEVDGGLSHAALLHSDTLLLHLGAAPAQDGFALPVGKDRCMALCFSTATIRLYVLHHHNGAKLLPRRSL